jgi:GNAT superfamily N-acetyltransferase
MIRMATASDEEAILTMAREFAAFAPYHSFITPTDDELRATIRYFIEHATVFVADSDGKVIGMLWAILSPMWYAPRSSIATELAWWVAPSHRRGTAAIRLVQAFERWAKDQGAVLISMSNLQVGNAYEVSAMLTRLGYSLTEQTHTKRI